MKTPKTCSKTFAQSISTLEVLDLLTRGDDHKQIAEKIFLSPFTVRVQLRNIFDKLHVHSKTQAVAKALQERLLPERS